MNNTTKKSPALCHKMLIIFIIVMVFGCAEKKKATLENSTHTQVDIGLITKHGQSVDSITTPLGYKVGDKLITYEGPGWESQLVGYRLYLDGRNAIDVFGKKTADMILQQVGRGDDYHKMRPWGMDILKVGASLGSGGFGVLEDDQAKQIGPARYYSAKILRDNPQRSKVEVVHRQSQKCSGDITARYSIGSNTRLTRVEVGGRCRLPLVAGLVKHPKTKHFSQLKKETGWNYIARYGAQSLVPDNLGLAIFFKSEDVVALGQDEDDDYIIFKNHRNPDYFFAATWEQEPSGIRDVNEFENWLKATLLELAKTSP
ncbi:MAG: hypothetical protein CBC09_07010 [Cellvibrionales bacterium TMED49]|nr:MAG: hypothetical protein CBC09_07010 [Cellvibrionales bacterium TMED49]